MILIDAILALALGTIFVAIIAGSSLGSRQIFERALTRDRLMDLYGSQKDSFTGMMPFQSHTVASTSASAIWYGNDRIETDIQISATGTVGLDPYEQSTAFKVVRAYPYPDPKNAVGTPLCSVDFFHGRKVPVASIVAIRLPISQSIPLTDLIVRDGVAYVSADSTVASDPDLFIFDIRDPNNAKSISSINTGPGISGITLAGQRIYAAADSAAFQLHIVRLDSLVSPILEKKFKLPLPYATATAPVADSIFYSDGRVYVGTEKWDGDEFNVIDVSNPINTNKLGGADMNSKVSAISIRSGIAYIASADQNQLRLMDVRDSANIRLTNAFGPSGWQRQEGQSVDFFEGALSFGRTSGGFDISADHEAFSWATSSAVGLANPFSLNDPGGVYGIVTDHSHVFLGTRQAGKEFKILGRSLSTSSTTYALPASVQSVTCENDSIYVLGHLSPVIYRITFN